MVTTTIINYLKPLLVGILLALLMSAPAFAQGCPMCKESASALGEVGQQSLNLGILMMAVPPFLMLMGIGIILFRRGREDVNSAGRMLPQLPETRS